MRQSRLLILTAITLLILSACIPANRERRQLLGTWDIVHSERIAIFEDGSTEVFEDLTDAGTLEISEGGVTGVLTDFVLIYTNFEGTLVNLQGSITVDEETSRILLNRFDCGSTIFNCSLVMNVQEDKRRQQIWTYFYTDPPRQGQYNPTANDKHFRWTLTLRKQ
ncbi:MAG: hypothetical protein AAF730_13540 [Bacteroidota bacterium]